MKKVTKRERYAITGVIVFLLFFLPSRFLLFPALEKLEILERAIPAQKQRLLEIKGLAKEFEKIQGQERLLLDQFKKRGESFSFLSYLEDLALKNGVKENIRYMKPAISSFSDRYEESAVSIRFSEINQDQLTKILFGLEEPEKNIRIRRLLIRSSGKGEDLLDVTMDLSTLQPKS